MPPPRHTSDDGQSIIYTRREHVYGKDSLTYIVDERYPAQLRITIQDPLDDDVYEMVQFDPEREFRVLRNDRFWKGYQGQRKITHVLDVPDGATARNGRSTRRRSSKAWTPS